ncbi:MAG TPA: ABC transporter ATP-binding protein, partial [Ktedonobacter sp.]|nr:ABC transporter ATP-binding protein [Ktedonobacter sp.]HBE27609.1 ABC transporter ATP-binding protein [Ktedonobacter sp.]HCF87389.1 ABC transporter ATP-binding protein [Ktedonobacter sp.]
MMQTTYGFGTSLKLPYDEAVQRVKDALQTEGFGVLSEIDVRKTMR